MKNLTKAIAVLGVVAGLGVTALPLSTYAALSSTDGSDVSTNTSVVLEVAKSLKIKASADEVALTGAPGADKIGDVKVTVTTNNTNGYALKIKGSAASNPLNLTSQENANDQILPVEAGVDAPATLALTSDGKSAWGYTVTGTDIVTAFTGEGVGKYAGVAGEDKMIATSDTQTSSTGTITTVQFGAKLAPGQPAGTYKGQVTFTASDLPGNQAEEQEP